MLSVALGVVVVGEVERVSQTVRFVGSLERLTGPTEHRMRMNQRTC
jgi:hypothetical protein